MGHDHALLPTKDELLAVPTGDLCIEGLSKSECYMWPVLWGLLVSVSECIEEEGRRGHWLYLEVDFIVMCDDLEA